MKDIYKAFFEINEWTYTIEQDRIADQIISNKYTNLISLHEYFYAHEGFFQISQNKLTMEDFFRLGDDVIRETPLPAGERIFSLNSGNGEKISEKTLFVVPSAIWSYFEEKTGAQEAKKLSDSISKAGGSLFLV